MTWLLQVLLLETFKWAFFSSVINGFNNTQSQFVKHQT